MNKSKKMNDKGFSLIELIVVIAIMVVLVAVLSPVFSRFIEQGRRATDVTNANSLAEAILIDIESGEFNPTTAGDDPASSAAEIKTSEFPSLKSVPNVQSTGLTGNNFRYAYNSTTHTVAITIVNDDNGDLTDPTNAENYKKDTYTE